ncbi:MAG: epsK [Verrucomicrobiaceae bacterium]|nr:epsK [Verrucomicrobiaceae bacterium]
MSLGKRFLQGAGLGLIEHGVRTASLFVTVPLMVKWLGVDNYGYWLTAMSVLAYFALLDLGMSFGTTRFMALAVGAKDGQKQAVVYRVATTHFHRMSVIIGIGSFFVFLAMPFIVTGGQHVSKTEVLIATIPVGLSMALRFWWRLPQLLLRAWVRYDWLSWAAIIRVTVQSAALILLLPHGGGLILVGTVVALSDVLEMTLQKAFAKRLPALHLDEVVEDEAAVTARRELVSFTRDIIFGMVGDGVRGNVGPQVMSTVVGLHMVPVYSMGTSLISKAEDVVNTLFGGGLLSVFGQMHGGGERERLHREFGRIMAITAGFGAATAAGLVIFGKAFMQRWLGDKFHGAYEVMSILALPYALFFMQYPAHSFLYALGWQRQVMWLRCTSGVLAGVFAIIFGLLWGFKGVAMGPALDMGLLYAIAFPWLVHRATGIPFVKYGWSNILWPGIKGLILPLSAAYAITPWILPDYPHLVACALIYALAMVVSVPLCLLDKEGRALILGSMSRGD